MVTITVSYQGNLRCSLHHGPSGTHLETDAPIDNHGQGLSFSPTDLVAAALGSCIGTVLGILAHHKEWNLAGMRISVVKEMSKEIPRRIIALPVQIVMPIDLDESHRLLVEKTANTCPVKLSIHQDINANLTFHWPNQ